MKRLPSRSSMKNDNYYGAEFQFYNGILMDILCNDRRRRNLFAVVRERSQRILMKVCAFILIIV